MRNMIVWLLAMGATFLADAQEEMILHGRWQDSSLVASSAHNNTYNEVWGLVNAGREYAVIGSTAGTHFIDVTDPRDPREVVLLEGGTTGREIIHRDYHDYAGYLYAVADEGSNSTLQIIDYGFLPDSVHVVYDDKRMIRRAHNIFIDSASAILYGCITRGDTLPWTPLRLFDLSNPVLPLPIASYNRIDGFQVSQVHDIYVRENLAYLNCGPSGMVIADFSDPLQPKSLASLSPSEYPQSGYNHSGWLSENGNTYFMADENHGMDIKVLDVSMLPDIQLIDTIDAGNPSSFSIPHNQLVHKDKLFVSYYYDGIQVYDISDRHNIIRSAYYKTSKIEPRARYEGAWGVYPFLPSGTVLVSDMQEGLFVLDLPVGISSIEYQPDAKDWHLYPNPSKGTFLTGNLPGNARIRVSDISGRPVLTSRVDETGRLDLEAGTYIINVISGHHYRSKILIVAK